LGHGVVGLIFAFLVGGPHLPLGLLIAGVTLSGIAAFFALSGNPEIDTDRFVKALKGGLDVATTKLWKENEEKLSRCSAWWPRAETDAAPPRRP
jgi:hypothetical protein